MQVEQRSICQFFQRGNCRFGNRCKNSHQQRQQPQQQPQHQHGGISLVPARGAQASTWTQQPQGQQHQQGFFQPQPQSQPQLQPFQAWPQPQPQPQAQPQMWGQPGGFQSQAVREPGLSLEEFRGEVRRGLWPLAACEGSGEGMSVEEYRLQSGGAEAVDAMVERRSGILGISLEAWRRGRPGELRANRFYPAFIPREPLVVVTDELVALM